MPDSRHEHLRRLFDKALDLPAAARTEFLDSKCGDDHALKQRLQSMLAAADDDHLLGAPTSGAPMPATDGRSAEALLREAPGARIGPYKLLQQIGEGGFGVVFLAEQEHPVARKVALKVVKLGMDTRQVVARFEQERQALAVMDHPNIARVLDAGATDTGRPYFVMDLVKGAPIVQDRDQNNLSIHERLDLFAQVCHAVQHAHGKGIIHRDLKPSNILVGTQDGKPQAKVIDFGIAKATSQKLTNKTLFTEHQQVVGTLQDMSPEQAEGSLDIDTRTDVYSLGVLLYELLTGSTPFDKKALQGAMISEMKRLIREVEPPRPSTRISESQGTIASIAAHRRIEPRRLGMLVRGDLDWIVMKALEKDRARRYETANGLAMDIRRHLAGEAVVAAPPSAAYRLRKFVRRNRGLVGALAAVGAALILGAVAFAWQAGIAGTERDNAVAAREAEAQEHTKADRLAAAESKQRQLAENNERKAEAINQFLVRMLGSANLRELGREVKVAQALDQAAATVDTAFKDRPEVEVGVRQILGDTYLSLGMLDPAAPHLEAALELRRKLNGEQSVDFARSLGKLAAWQEQKGDVARASESFQRAVEVARQGGPESELTLTLQTQFANCLVRLKREPEAEVILRRVRDAFVRTLGADAGETQIATNSLAVLLHNLGRLDEAETLYREAVESGERALGPEHPDTLTARTNLASVLRSRGDVAAAEPMMAKAYAGIRRVYGEQHPKTGRAAHVLANLYAAQGRYKEALPLHEEGLAILRRVEGERTADVASMKSDLAMTLNQLGELKRAVALLREVVEWNTTLHGAGDRETLMARLDLTNTLAKDRQFAEAEPMFTDLLQVCARTLGEDDPATIIATNSYAVMLLGQERYADAEPYLKKALDSGMRVQGKDHKNTLITQMNYIGVLRELGRLEEAAAAGSVALAGFEKVFGPKHPNTATAHASFAQTLVKLDRNEEAKAHLVEAIATRKAATGDKNPTYAGDALILARMLADTGHPDEAEPILREIVDSYTAARGANHRTVAVARVEIGNCRTGQRRFAEAEPLLLENLALQVNLLPMGKKDVQRAQRCLAKLYEAWQAAEPDPARAAKAEAWRKKAEAPQ